MIHHKKIMIFIFFGLVCIACTPNRSEPEPQENSNLDIHVQSLQKCLEPIHLLNQIYQSRLSIDEASEAELNQYFNPRLTRLILNEQKCRKDREICEIDFDILSNSQDRADYSFRITQTKNPYDYYVFIQSENLDATEQRILYEFDRVSTTQCSKIKLIRYADGRYL